MAPAFSGGRARAGIVLVAVGVVFGAACGRSCYVDSAEGPCLATVRSGVSASGIPYSVEACGEVVLRVD